MDSIEELRSALEQARATNQALHRRVQHAEAKGPATRSRGRAKLATDYVRLTTSLGKIRALAAGWGGSPYRPVAMQDQALRDIAEEAEAALTPRAGG